MIPDRDSQPKKNAKKNDTQVTRNKGLVGFFAKKKGGIIQPGPPTAESGKTETKRSTIQLRRKKKPLKS